MKINLFKLAEYILKRIWVPILCGIIGFAALFCRTKFFTPDTYTSSGTMYVYNGNPNLINYQYTNTNDLDSAVKLIDTYMIVVKSNKVMDVIVERLTPDYPGIQPGFIMGSLSMASVSETGVVRVSSTTGNPQMSADIVNAVLDAAPEEIIRVVGAGSIEIIDYASAPLVPDGKGAMKRGALGALAGIVLGGGLLFVLFSLNRKVADTHDITENYTPPVLASVLRVKEDNPDAGSFMLTDKSPMEILEGYARLRMNLLFTLVGKDSHSVVITSAISGEGKSTIAANLAISCGMGGKKVLLVDGDLRRACQRDIFGFEKHHKGLSESLVGSCIWQETVLKDMRENLDILPAGQFPPNPAELLGSEKMKSILAEMEETYDLVLLDMPPVNIVTDPLVLSDHVAGCVFVIRQDYSDHRDVRNALISAEMTNMNVMGFAFYGENIHESGYYYRRKYYKSYYNKYDYRKNPAVLAEQQAAKTKETH